MDYKKGGLGNKYKTLDTTTKLDHQATFLSQYYKSIKEQVLKEEKVLKKKQFSEEEKLELKNTLNEIENKYKITIIGDLTYIEFLNTLNTKINVYFKIIQNIRGLKNITETDIFNIYEKYKKNIDLKNDLTIIGKTDDKNLNMKYKNYILRNFGDYDEKLDKDFNEIKHLLYNVPNEDTINDDDFDEINDILINKIKKILCSESYDDLKELTKTDAETEKILRIVIVLLYENHTDYHNIMMNISKLFLISDNIKTFYKFTTGKII
jgi:hypothetical protein